jgi:enoyl-CoA hydratase/carnithine racemase
MARMSQSATEPSGAGVLVDEPVRGVRRVRLNRPSQRNAIDRAMYESLHAALEEPPALTVLSSTDPAAFCSGMDLNVPEGERAALSDALYDLYARMISADSIVIVALNGPAVGAGAQLAVAADLRIAHPDAWLRFPGVGHGLAVGAWGLTSLIGRGRALRACVTMDRISAPVGREWGLIDGLEVEPEDAAVLLASALAGHHSAALVRVKHVTVAASALQHALAEEQQRNREAWQGSIAGLER